MPDSRTVELYMSDGATMPKAQTVEVSQPDDEGDVSIEIWEGGRSTLLMWASPESLKRLIIALMETL